MNATGRVHSPRSRGRPPKNSNPPENQDNERNSGVPPRLPPNRPKSFCAPCAIKRNAVMMRRTLSKRGAHPPHCEYTLAIESSEVFFVCSIKQFSLEWASLLYLVA